MMKKPAGRNSLIVTIPLVAIAMAWVFIVFLPIQKAIGRLEDEAEQMRQYCKRSSCLMPVLRRTSRELDNTRDQIIYWDETAPSQRDLSALLGKITALARSSGLRTTRFDPEPIVAATQLPLRPAISNPGYHG